MPVAPPFAGLPEGLARLLLVGGTGAGLVPARDAAMAAGEGQAGLADALALAVWEDAPLWPEAARVLAARQAARPFLAPEAARVAAAVAGAPAAAPEPYFDRLAARRDIPKMLAYLLDRHRKQPDDAGVLHRLAVFAPMAATAGDAREAEDVLAGLGGPYAAIGRLVAGELALLSGRLPRAEDLLRQSLAAMPTPAARARLAEVLVRQGGRGAALREYAAVRQARPFDVLALSRLHDLASGLAGRVAALPGSLAVLLYSYRNAALLDRTLAALAATDWGQAPIAGGPRLFVLDNGSPDGTASVLAGWKDRLGARLEMVSLPVNVGAPAARNWLAALPGVRERDFAAYLDDDAVAPADWIGRLGAAVAAYPDAGVWGCRVVGIDAPHHVQSGDAHLLPTPRQDGEYARAFDLARPWLAGPNWGQFAVCRPCASVTGCCHLFRTDVLTAVGGFDIRFSPSQYDDLDHDLRLLASGRTPVFQGHLAVVHAKVTGAAGNPGGAAYGSGFANQFKLHNKYDDAAIASAARTAFAALAADAAAKVRAVREWGRGEQGEGGGGR